MIVTKNGDHFTNEIFGLKAGVLYVCMKYMLYQFWIGADIWESMTGIVWSEPYDPIIFPCRRH